MFHSSSLSLEKASMMLFAYSLEPEIDFEVALISRNVLFEWIVFSPFSSILIDEGATPIALLTVMKQRRGEKDVHGSHHFCPITREIV